MKPIRADVVTILPSDQRDHVLCMYFNDIRSTKPLEHEETIRYIISAQSGDEEALNKIVVSNLKFVVTVAKRYLINGIDIKDLISEGNLGLIDAIMAYDTKREKKVKFISYAVFHIRKRILRYIEKNISLCKIPQNIMRHLVSISKYTDQEKANEYYNMLYYYYPDVYNKIVNAIYATRFVSLYSQIDFENDKMLIEVVANEDMSNSHKKEEKRRDIRMIIEKCMNILDDNEKKIIETYYIKCRGECSMEFASSLINMPFEEFMKAHKTAMRKMRKYILENMLKETLEILHD